MEQRAKKKPGTWNMEPGIKLAVGIPIVIGRQLAKPGRCNTKKEKRIID